MTGPWITPTREHNPCGYILLLVSTKNRPNESHEKQAPPNRLVVDTKIQ